MGNGLLLGFGHLLEEVFEHRLSGNPFERLEPECRLAARTSELRGHTSRDRLIFR